MTGELPAEASPSFFTGARPALLLAAAAALLYAHSLSFDLVYLDDEILVLQNAPVISEVSNIGRLFSTDVFLAGKTPYYRPVLNLSFMLDALAGGPPYFVFHLTNLLLHAAATVLLFFTLTALGSAGALAFALSLLFAFHPSLAQAAAWLPGRNDSLLAVFTLTAFLLFLRWQRGGAGRYGAWCAVFFALALLTKETALVLPPLFYLYSRHAGGLPSRAAYWGFALGITALWALARHAALPPGQGELLAGTLNALINLPNMLLLLGKTVFPLNPQVWPTLEGSSFLPGAAALALVFAASRSLRPGPLSTFGLAWYAMFIFPTLASSKHTYGVLFWEHRLYLPLAGFMIFLAGLQKIRDADLRGFAARAVLLLAIPALAVTSYTHSFVFSGRLAFWERAVEEAPDNFTANLNLGYTAQFERLDSMAERHYRAALLVRPGEPFIHKNLGLIYARHGEPALARTEFQAELAVNPSIYECFETYRKEPRLERALRGLKPPEEADTGSI